MHKKELLIFLAIVAIAGFFRLYNLGLTPPGLYPDEAMMGFVSAIIGILTVIGLYLLVKELFEWRLAAVAGFLLAISFWHVNFSRAGFQAIIVPFVLVYLFFFLWRGLRTGRLSNYLLAGIIGGLGFYTDVSYRIAPLIGIIIFLNYWQFLKKDFSFSNTKYEHSRNQLLRGFALTAITVIIVALPIGFYFWTHQNDFLKQENASVSVFARSNPLKELGLSVVKTLGMFNFSGDYNPLHNIPGSPMLPWPIGIFFVVGFINELIHWLKRKHGHFSTVHTLMFSWFVVMLLPGFLSIEAPDALKTLGVLPMVMLFSAKGIWWIFDKLNDWYELNDKHEAAGIYGRNHHPETHAVVALTLIIFLGAIGFYEYWRYFNDWTENSVKQISSAHSIIIPSEK